MPFMPVTKRMATQRAARRKTLQGYEVKALGSRYESAQKAARQEFERAQTGLLSEYQAGVADYSKRLGEYEQNMRNYEAAAGQYQQRADEYNRKVELFNTYTRLPGKFIAYDEVLRPDPRDPGYEAITVTGDPRLSGLQGVYATRLGEGTSGAPTLLSLNKMFLPGGFNVEYANERYKGRGVYYLTTRAGPDPGEFTESFPEATFAAPMAPTPPDMSGLADKFSAEVKKEQDVYEREIGERKLAAQRARRRTADRPLLAGESV